jgi:hypothetical protein
MTWAGKQSEQTRSFQSPETYLLLTLPFIERTYRRSEIAKNQMSGLATYQELTQILTQSTYVWGESALMVPQNAKARLTEAAAEEVRQDQYLEGRIEQRLRRWKRGTVWLGIALVCCVVAVVPFLYGYPLHDYWDAVGKKILVLSMCLLPLFMFSAGITYMFWSYLRAIKNVHRRFVPPGSNS